MFLYSKNSEIKGREITQIISMGMPRVNPHLRWDVEYHSISVSILTTFTPVSIVIHLNTLTDCWANFGCKRNIIVIKEIAMYLWRSFTHFLRIIHIISQIAATITNRINGRILVRNSLKNAFEGNGPRIS